MKFDDIARRIELFIKDLGPNDDDIVYAEKEWFEESESDILYLNVISHLELAKNNLRLASMAADKEAQETDAMSYHP